RVIDVVGHQLYAPTPGSRANLAREHLGGQILVTGNTVIDALQQTVQRLDADPALRAQADEPFHILDPGRRLLLVTGHRRESFGQGFEDICRALAELARRPDLQVLYPVHLNPNVQGPVNAHLGNLDNVHLVPPQDYLRFVRLMQRAD
ncbi:UDP-N-acetylglucosamine 2-epimerase (non-hydrolyzing), partial [Corallococcus sp. AB049A]|uniref:UDP-N-acetylglucosamine 2-epimerase n=1 Tax=Corallococcus sp. AB049A TaxID=2316721 RepID=UPI000ED54BE8